MEIETEITMATAMKARPVIIEDKTTNNQSGNQ